MPIEVHFEKRIVNNNVIREADAKSHRDYIIWLDPAPDGTAVGQEILVTAPAALNVPVGSNVNVKFRPERCRALAA